MIRALAIGLALLSALTTPVETKAWTHGKSVAAICSQTGLDFTNQCNAVLYAVLF